MEELLQRLIKVETKVDHHDEIMKGQLEKNEVLLRLATLMESQSKESSDRERRQETRDEKQNKQMQDLTSTLSVMNENLSHLNSAQQQLNVRVSAIEVKQDEATKNTTIDLSSFLKKTILWIVGVVGVVLSTYIMIRLGLK